MALTRAEREAQFRALHGVSSGTYYAMRRNAASAGISPKTFDKLARSPGGYGSAREVTQMAREGRRREPGAGVIHDSNAVDRARHTAAQRLGLIPSSVSLADFYDIEFDYDFPDDFDWWYH